MAAYTFYHHTLNDNWFEDRQQPAGALSATGPVHKKTARAYETEIAFVGDRYDVLARIQRVPPKPSYASPDDGFNEKATTATVDFAHPKSRKDFVAKPPEKPRFITTETVPEVCHEDRRPVPGNQRGFGAPLNRHEEGHEQRFFSTTNREHFGTGDPKPRTKMEPSGIHHAGRNTELIEASVSGTKTGRLCGEDFRESADPATDTRTQRAWLYSSDASLKNIHLGGSRPVPPTVDNHLNLPLGMGHQSKIRAELKERKGLLYRTATHITKGASKRSGVSIFEDHPGDHCDSM